MNKKILVTGGAGFIGGSFVDLCINKELEIILVDKLTYAGNKFRLSSVKDKVNFYKTDVSDYLSMQKIFEATNPDYVVHFAAESHVDRSIDNAFPFMQTNVIGTQVLLDCSRKYGVEKFVNISTDEVYGDLDLEGEFFEDTPFNPSSPYSVSKASADMLGNAYYRTFGLPVVTVRPSNNYGIFQYPEKLIPVVIIKALNNHPIPVYGKGDNVREWLYVDDCALGIFNVLMKAEPGSVYNIGSGIEKTNIEVVEAILNILSKPQSLIEFVEDRLGHDFRYSLNSDKLTSQIGYKPQTKFDEGIKKTVNWYLNNVSWWEKIIALD